ncbi:hypothetical protein LTR35_017649 [Friedmanniomyces endolithicus]|nr:hypothetical protein LTR35_017649 [Friedmanniomyces endolithicus]
MASKVEIDASDMSSATSHVGNVLNIDVLHEAYELREREEQCLAQFYDAFGRHLGADDYDCGHDGATPLLRWLKEVAQHSDDPDHVVRLREGTKGALVLVLLLLVPMEQSRVV